MQPSLYIHVPFCAEKCDYCDFYSIVTPDRAAEERYVSAAIKQLRDFTDRFEIQGFSTVYLGGGTPSILSVNSLQRLCNAVSGVSDTPVVEWTIEANPESCSEGFFSMLKDLPVTRLSMGIQSFSPLARAFIGRRGGIEQLDRSLELVFKWWNGNISLDFIRGLPPGIALSPEEELSRVPLERIDHLSFYDLTLEPGTPLAKRLGTLPETAEDSFDFLADSGFFQYEVGNYAHQGKESLHNTAYWEMDSYVGIGPGAVSLIVDDYGGTRFTVKPDIDRYLSQCSADGSIVEVPSKAEFFMEHLIMGMRQIRGLSQDRVLRRFGADMTDIIPDTVKTWRDTGGLCLVNGRYRLEKEYYAFQNRFFVEAWQELDRKKPLA